MNEGISQEDLELLKYLLVEEGVEREQDASIVAQAQEGQPAILSFAQEQMWLLNRLEPESSVYNMPLVLSLRGSLDIEALEKSFNEIIQRHAILRSTFGVRDGKAQQFAQPFNSISVQRIDLRDQPEAAQHEQVRHILQQEAEYTFDLEHGPLLRATVMQVEDGHWIFALVLHHIIADMWSLEVLMRDLGASYSAHLQGIASPLPPLSIQYADYAIWQRATWDGDTHHEERDYWLQQLANAPFVLELPTTYRRPAVQTFHGATYPFTIANDTLQSLRHISQRESASMFMVLLAAFQTLLLRYTDQEDILVGCPIANRDLPEVEPLIGVFINTLVMRTDLSSNPSFRALLERVKVVAAEAYQHQHVPFEYLVKRCEPTRDISRNPLVQIMFAYQNTAQQVLALPDLEVQPLPISTNTAKVDVILHIEEAKDMLQGSIEYNTDLYDQSFIASFVQCFQTLLQGIVQDPEQHLLDFPLLASANAESAPQDLINEQQRIDCTYPEQSTITSIFEDVVEKFPHNIALKFEGMQLTYAALNSRANTLARMLREKIHQPDTLVGIYAERSLEMVVGMLAILKAGAAYLPLDPHYPEARLYTILEDSRVQIVCTQSHLVADLSPAHERMLLDTIEYEDNEVANLVPIHTASSMAYVIYTSGTTGKPKGVMVEHRQVVQLLHNDQFPFDFDEHDCWTMFHSFCFDFSVWEMYGALLYGGQLIVIPQTTTLNVPAYHDVLKTERVTILNQTPGAFLQLCEEEKKHTTHDLSLRYVIFGGEALMPGRLRQWNQDYPATRLINMYGITETTVHVTYKEITQAEIQADISNIGVALPPVSVYILNARLKPVPRGVAGEIFVGGEGVARGYLHNPELTQQRFIDDPYRPGKRMYRTGDLGKWTTDGEIEYVGRADQQVKIHGFRIEIGEIESHIRTFQDVTDVIVLPVEDAQGALALCCYVMTTRAHDPYSFIAELKSYLKQHLPVHMLPAFIVPLDDLPLTEHGKLNKAALPDPRQFVDAGEVYVPPRDHMERLLVEIWADVLKLPEEKIGIQSRFFDLGGNSFNVFELHTRVQAMLGKQISMMSYFQYPTIASFVEHLDTPGAALEASSEAQEPEEDVDAIDAYSMMDELTRLAGEE